MRTYYVIYSAVVMIGALFFLSTNSFAVTQKPIKQFRASQKNQIKKNVKMPVKKKVPQYSIEGDYRDGIPKEGNTYAEITVKYISSSKVKIQGFSQWINPITRGSNFGWIDGVVAMHGTDAVYKKDDCILKVKFENKKLIAEDNEHCGGMNAGFTGTYTKASQHIPKLESMSY